MPSFVMFTDLTSETTLKLVADYLHAPGAEPDLLRDIQLRSVAPVEIKNVKPIITLIMPQLDSNASKKDVKAAELFNEIYSKVSGKDRPAVHPAYPFHTSAPSLLATLPSLLKTEFSRASIRRHNRTDELINFPLQRDEKLLVSLNLTAEKSAELFRQAQFYATQIKATFCEVIEKKDGQQPVTTQYFLFHVKDNPERGSDFESAWKSGMFGQNSILLDCYRDQSSGYLVCLPETVVPRREYLADFCRVLLKAPGLFNGPTPSANADILAIALPLEDSSGDFTVLMAAHLHFQDDWEVAPVTAEVRPSQYLVPQNSAEALQKLRQQIERDVPQSGHRLELRRAHYQRGSEAEYNRLLLQQNQIEDRLIELESLGNEQPRPRLYRFTQRQLHVLADVLRSYRADRLKELKYAYFSAQDYHPEGFHFIYVPPELPLGDLDPLVWWGDDENQPMEFWLDPYWAYHYQGDADSIVFVPKGKRLYPALHSWNPATMDDYLRSVLGDSYLRGNDGKPREILEPLYIFDSKEQYKTVFVTIIGLEDFVEIGSPECLGWLNQNLCVLEELGTQKLIERMANNVTRDRITRAVSKRSDTIRTVFETQTEALRTAVSKETGELAELLNDELKTVIENTTKLAMDAAAQNEKLKELLVLYMTTQQQVNTTDQYLTDAWKEHDNLDMRITELVTSVEQQITNATEKHVWIEDAIRTKIENLEETHRRLNKMIQGFRQRFAQRNSDVFAPVEERFEEPDNDDWR